MITLNLTFHTNNLNKLFISLLILPFYLFSQPHSIDNINLEMIGTTSFNNVSSNTYYNTYDSCNVLWNMIDVSIPAEWEFSFCFPNCYSIGQISAQENFAASEQIYLGCHFYPNGASGFGTIQLEIVTNGIYKDTITWAGTIQSTTSLNEVNVYDSMNIVQVYDIYGRRINSIKFSGLYIVEYENLMKKIYYNIRN